MANRLVTLIGAFATAIALVGAAPAGQHAARTNGTPSAGTWTPARTGWGDPDLIGIWSAGYFFTPLERPAKYAGREFLTDAEMAALEKDGGHVRHRWGAGGNNGRGRPDRGTVADVEGAYNDIFSGRGRNVIRTKRTSLAITAVRFGRSP